MAMSVPRERVKFFYRDVGSYSEIPSALKEIENEFNEWRAGNPGELIETKTNTTDGSRFCVLFTVTHKAARNVSDPTNS